MESINPKLLQTGILLLFTILLIGTKFGIFRLLKKLWLVFNKSSDKRQNIEPSLINPTEWMKKVYDTITETDLWTHKLDYEDYLKAIEKYSMDFYKLPSEDDLKNPAAFTRGIFSAIEENIIHAGGFDYESGYEDLFETIARLLKKAKIPFSWKKVSKSLYKYEVDKSKYELDLSKGEDIDMSEVTPEADVEVESNISKSLQKQDLYLVHTYTGDQTADYVLLKKEHFSKLKEIFPNADDYQIITNGEVQDL